MSITEGYQQHSGDVAGWFEQYQQELKKRYTVPLQSVYPYIFFKLAHDFAFSKGNSMHIHDPLEINAFMGDFCYTQVIKDFKRSAIVMQTQTERMYFGSPSISRKRMRNYSLQTGRSVDDFEAFINCLEEKVFQRRLPNFDEWQKETLGMILRIINQGIGAVAIKMLNAYLLARSGETNQVSFDGLKAIRYLMRPDMGNKKGSSQIDILYDDDGKIQLYRREYLRVQKLDMDALAEPDAAMDERWCLMVLLSRDSSDWRLHFSVSNITDDCQSTIVSSSAKSPNKARQLGRVSNVLPLCHSDQSISSDGSPMSIDSLCYNSKGWPDYKKSDVKRLRSRRRRSIRDLLHRRKPKQSPKLVYNSLDWLKQEYSDVKRTRDFQEFQPFIDLMLSHDLSQSHGRCLETQDWVAINNFLGSFCYSHLRERFNQNNIVLTTETEKLYFGTSAPPNDNRSIHEDDSCNGDFVAFITCLEKKVLKRSIGKINKCQKRTLGVILRFLSQNSSAVVSQLFKLCVQTGQGSGDMEYDTIQVEGLAQIGIESKGNNIYLSKEQNLILRKSDEESKLQFKDGITESWKMVTNIMQISSLYSSNWSLQFSVVRNYRKDRLTLTPSDSSQNSLSFCYPGTTSHNCWTSYSSSKTSMYGHSVERSSPDHILMNGSGVKKSEPAILRRPKRETQPDKLRNRINYAAATPPSRAWTEVDNISGFRRSEFKRTLLRPAGEKWIAKDDLGI